MDAPREVFVVFDESFNSIEDVYTREHGNQDPEAHEVKFIRADLAPSARRVPSVRESLAKAGIPFVDSGEVERLSRPGGFEDSAPTAVAPSAQPPADSAWQPAESSAKVRRLAEYIVAHADDPERCVCVHDRREHRNGAGPCMHGYDGHVVDCASDCRMYQPDTEYREPSIVTESRAVLASPEAPAKENP